MIPSPQDILYFVELANTLNFSRASERIGISQPSLSAAIKRLELELNTLLFHRNKNETVLTKSGKQLLMHSKKLLDLWENIKTETLFSSEKVQGCVSIGCHQSVAISTLHQFLPDLIHTYPKLEIKLQHDLSRKTAEKVINHSLDIGIVVNPIKHPDLIIRKLYSDTISLYISKNITNPHDILLRGKAVIVCDPELMQTQHIFRKMQKNSMKFQRLITTSSLEVIAKLTAYGVGFGVLPAHVVKASHEDNLVMLENSPIYNDEICVIYRNESRFEKSVQTIIQTIKSAFQQ